MEQLARTLKSCHELLSDLNMIEITPTANKRIKRMIKIIETAGQHLVEIQYPPQGIKTFKGFDGKFSS